MASQSGAPLGSPASIRLAVTKAPWGTHHKADPSSDHDAIKWFSSSLYGIPLQKSRHTMNPAARLDALEDINLVAAQPGGLVALTHAVVASGHDDLARGHGDEVQRKVVLGCLLVLDFDEAKAPLAQRVHHLEGGAARPDDGQIAVGNRE